MATSITSSVLSTTGNVAVPSNCTMGNPGVRQSLSHQSWKFPHHHRSFLLPGLQPVQFPRHFGSQVAINLHFVYCVISWQGFCSWFRLCTGTTQAGPTFWWKAYRAEQWKMEEFCCTLLLSLLELAINLWEAGYKRCWANQSWFSLVQFKETQSATHQAYTT